MPADLAPGRYRIGDLVVDVGQVTVRRGAALLHVPGLSFDTLVCLLRHAPDAVSRERLVAEVWDGAALGDETITQRIALLRRALGDDGRAPRYVGLVRGRGYRLLIDPVPLARRRPPHPRRPVGRRLAAAAAAAGLLGLGAAVAHRAADGPSPREVTTVAAPAPGARSLERRGWTYLARHRETDNRLAAELFSRALAADPADQRARAGLSLALSQRTAKFNGSERWAEAAAALARHALAADPRLAEGHHALGLALDARGRVGPALAEYRRAVALDPRHAGALASAAYLLAVRGELATALRWDLRALDLGPDLPYVELQVAEVLAALGHDDAAAGWFRRAVALRPDNLFADAAFAHFRLARGEIGAARALADRAVAHRVRRGEPWRVLGDAAWLEGRRDAAVRSYRQAVRVDPRAAGAAARLALLEGRRNDLAAQAERLAAGLAAGDEWPGTAVALAVAQTGRGDAAGALAALSTAVGLGYRDAAWLARDPAFAGLRGTPRFRALLARIGREVRAQEALAERLPGGAHAVPDSDPRGTAADGDPGGAAPAG